MTFSVGYYEPQTGTPPVKIECLVMRTTAPLDPECVFEFSYKIFARGAVACNAKGTVSTSNEDEAKAIAYRKVIDSLAEILANVLETTRRAGVNIEVTPR